MIALLALNVELETIPNKTKDPMAGLIRIKWWRDQIDLIYTNAVHSPSPILEEIKRVIETHKIPQILFHDLCECYETILRGTPTDPDDSIYALCGAILHDKKSKDKFSKKLYLHDTLAENTKFRTFRLWLGV